MNNWFLYCKKADFCDIASKFNISPILARILVNRGLETDKDIQTFLFAGRESFHDPFLFKDMKKAVDITLENIKQKKKIRIIGDYDVDGVCSSYILKRVIKELGGDVDVRLPHRILEGYGMSSQMTDDAKEDNVSLIITCDNGISSFDAVTRAAELDINVIITDHHEPPAVLPPAAAIVDAKQNDCTYPYRELCGAAVAYKFCAALIKIAGKENNVLFEKLMDELLTFAGMATITDIVPLKGENRIFAKEGIKQLRKTDNPGLKALMEIKGISSDEIREFHIGFILGPCINSAGRLADAHMSFELFDTQEFRKAKKIAQQLYDLNEQRKMLTQEQFVFAENIIKECMADDKVFVVYLPQAHESVAGIIAGKLKDKYNRPALIITESEDGLKGSGRSTDDYNLIEALARNERLLKKYGGHAKAAGFTLNCDADELRKVLNSEKEAEAVNLITKVWIDMQLPFRYVSEEMISEIELLAPFGLDNERPLFAEKNVVFSNVKVLGKNMNTLKMNLRNENGESVEGIYFEHGNAGVSINDIMKELDSRKEKARFMILYRPNVNEFRGNRYLQAIIESVKIMNQANSQE